MINQVVLVGRTTKDIELAYTRNNKAYTKLKYDKTIKKEEWVQ